MTLEISRPGNDGDEPFDVTVRLGENDDGGGLLGVRYSFPGIGFEINRGNFREQLEGLGRDQRGRFHRLEFLPEDNSEI